MKIHSYVLSMPDERDTLPDALRSLDGFSDKIFVVDGGLGGGTQCYHPRYTAPVSEWIFECGLLAPLKIWSNEFRTPGEQRNFALGMMAREAEQPDWIFWLDSDEIASNELVNDIRPYLKSMRSGVTNVCPKWLTLTQDEQHYAPSHSNYLSHARIHRPGVVQWSSSWHEHMRYTGERVVWERYIIHTRMLFRKRLLLQHGHDIYDEKTWSDVTAEPILAGVTWSLHWPEGEPVNVPLSESIRRYI